VQLSRALHPRRQNFIPHSLSSAEGAGPSLDLCPSSTSNATMWGAILSTWLISVCLSTEIMTCCQRRDVNCNYFLQDSP
jgi:hypothetical protein